MSIQRGVVDGMIWVPDWMWNTQVHTSINRRLLTNSRLSPRYKDQAISYLLSIVTCEMSALKIEIQSREILAVLEGRP